MQFYYNGSQAIGNFTTIGAATPRRSEVGICITMSLSATRTSLVKTSKLMELSPLSTDRM